MTAPGDSHRHPLLARLQSARARHKRRNKAFRVVFALAGVLVTLGGTALLVLPGPAFAIIPVGLFMLAMEFAWAERALHKAIVRAEDARRKAAATSTLQRVLAGVATALAVCAAVTAVLLWNIPVLPG